MGANMTQVEVTWRRALQVFSSLLWRAAVVGLVPALLIGTVAYDVASAWFAERETALPVPPGTAVWLSLAALGIVFALVVGTGIVKVVLGKAYSDFRIVLEGPAKRYRIEPRLERKAGPARRPPPALTIDPSAAVAAVRQHGLLRQPRPEQRV